MELLSKNKSDILLALLFIESVVLSSVVESTSIFWFFFIASGLTVIAYVFSEFDISIKSLPGSSHRNDALLIFFMTMVLNANIAIFLNRIVALVIFALYYLVVRYLLEALKGNIKNQIQKNALNLAVLITIFLSTNIFTNMHIVLEKKIGGLSILLLCLATFSTVYFLSYYSFVKNNIVIKWARVYSYVLAVVLTEVLLIASFYIESYPSLYGGDGVASLSITTTSLFLTVFFYSLYGLMMHKVNKKFHPKIILEYISISIVIILTLFLTIKWFVA